LRVIRSIAVGACILVLAGCTGQSSPPSTSPSQLLADGTRALDSLTSVQVTGTFTIDQTSGAVTALILRNGDVSGSLTLGATSSNFVLVDGTTYFQSLASFVLFQFPSSVIPWATSVKGPPWWKTPGTPAAAAVVQLLSLESLTSTFLSGQSRLTQTQGKDSRGRASVELSNAGGSVFIATSQLHQVLEIKTAPGFAAGGFTGVDLVFDDFNAPTTIAVPTDVVIPDLADLPPHFYIASVGYSDCGSSGCNLKAVVKADAGNGTEKVTLTIADTGGELLGTCTTSVTLPAYTATHTAMCRVGGRTWTAWWDRGVGKSTIHADVANPDYYSG
jgi:hypothetical protein